MSYDVNFDNQDKNSINFADKKITLYLIDYVKIASQDPTKHKQFALCEIKCSGDLKA